MAIPVYTFTDREHGRTAPPYLRKHCLGCGKTLPNRSRSEVCLECYPAVPDLEAGAAEEGATRRLGGPSGGPVVPVTEGPTPAASAALYLRVSTEDQDLAGQERDLRTECALRGWEVVAVYAEKVTGTGRVERKEHERLLADAARPGDPGATSSFGASTGGPETPPSSKRSGPSSGSKRQGSASIPSGSRCSTRRRTGPRTWGGTSCGRSCP